MAYVLVTCKRKDGDGKTAKRRNGTCPMDNTNWTPIGHGITLYEMVKNQDHQVAYACQRRKTGIFEGIQTSKVGERNDDQPGQCQHPVLLISQTKI